MTELIGYMVFKLNDNSFVGWFTEHTIITEFNGTNKYYMKRCLHKDYLILKSQNSSLASTYPKY